MTEKNFSVVLTDTATNDSVAFPATPEKIGKFISGLLGQPQTISREVSGIFDIDLSWLLHVHALVEQRIKQQNDAARTAFRAKVYYEDDLTRTIESFEGLQHFSETKKIRSTGIEVKWTYVIKFPGKDLPEKQDITLRLDERGTRFVTIGLQLGRERTGGVSGLIEYSISHTERTWGDDIESILRQEIEQITSKTKWYESYLDNTLMFLASALLLAGFLFPDYMNDRLQARSLANIEPVILQISNPDAVSKLDVPQKLDLLIKLVDPRNGVSKVGIKYRVACAVAGFFLMSLCVYWSGIRRASFVVLTKEAENHRAKTLRKEQRRLLFMALSFMASIATGVLGNYAYLYLTT